MSVPENISGLMTILEEEIKNGKIHDQIKELKIRLSLKENRSDYNLNAGIRRLIRSKKRSRTLKSGGGKLQEMKVVLFSIVMIIAFSSQYDRVSEYFEGMITHSSLFFDKIVKPFFVVEPFLLKKEKSMTKHSLSLPLIGLTANEISIASIHGLFKKILDSLKNGDVLAFNGLWATWSNAEKFRLYMFPKEKDLSPEKIKEMYEKGMKNLDQLVFHITTQKDYKVFEIPYGSKLITHKSICP
jgi:hypothetical protein